MFIRVAVISGVLVASGKAGKEDSLSALQSAAGIGRTVGTSGSQLEVTKKLQQTLGDTIMQSVKNSDPKAMERISGDFVKVLTDQVVAMKTAVKAENTDAQSSIENKINAVAKCNEAKGTRFTNDVNPHNSKLHTLRLTHAECRGAEVVAVDDQTEKCRKAQRDADAAGTAKPGCLCGGSTEKGAMLTCMDGVKSWVTSHLAALEAADVVCDDKVKIAKAKQGECDRAQGNFEAEECVYSVKLGDTCVQLDSCHEDALTGYQNEVESVKLKEVSHKELLTAITHVECLIGLFKEAKTKNLVEKDVADCLDDTIDTSDLNVDYGEAAAKVVCDTSTVFWNATEYDAFNATHIEVRTNCVNKHRGAGAFRGQLRYHVSGGLCLSMAASNGGTSGCDASRCEGHGSSDATLQPCNVTDPFQLFTYSASDRLLRSASDSSRCLYVGTSGSHGACEPFTFMNCVASDARQQFTKEPTGASAVWRNDATALAIDVNGYANRQDNWVWACPGSNSAKYFDPVPQA